MVLHLVGLGLGDERDITLKGLEAVRKSKRVLMERYTSELGVAKERLEELYGKEVEEADRELVEQRSEEILDEARSQDMAFLVVGDVLSATTHAELLCRAREMGIGVNVVHNASIINAVGTCGLQIYRFGQAVSMVFFEGSWRPQSFYDRIKQNRSEGLHTLLLLDIRVKEPTMRALCRGTDEYLPPRYMTTADACKQLLEVEEERGEEIVPPHSLAIALARIGQESERICAASVRELSDENAVAMGPPVHSLVLPANELHPIERRSIRQFLLSDSEIPASSLGDA